MGRRGKGVESAAVKGCEGREANRPQLQTRVEPPAGDGDPGHRTSPSEGGGLPPASPSSGRVAVVVEPKWQGSGMNDDTEPIGISTRKGIDRVLPAR